MVGLIEMKNNQLAFYRAKQYPLQVGKLYFVEYLYINDDDQNSIDCGEASFYKGRMHSVIDKGRMNNVTCVILIAAVKYENKWSKTISWKAKILTSTGIIGWVSSIYFDGFQLIES